MSRRWTDITLREIPNLAEARVLDSLLQSEVSFADAWKTFWHYGSCKVYCWCEGTPKNRRNTWDHQNVVKYMLEVWAPKTISSGEHLITYSASLEINYARLTSLSIKHKMSITCELSLLVKAFPQAVCKKDKRISSRRKTMDVLNYPPLFIQWLIPEKTIRECIKLLSAPVELLELTLYAPSQVTRLLFS